MRLAISQVPLIVLWLGGLPVAIVAGCSSDAGTGRGQIEDMDAGDTGSDADGAEPDGTDDSSTPDLQCVPGLVCDGNDLVACGEGGDLERTTCPDGCGDVGDGPACLCDAIDECGDEEYCGLAGSCQPTPCLPGAAECDGQTLVVCDADGQPNDAVDCGSLTCTAQGCICVNDGQCADDEFCDDADTCQAQVCEPGLAECQDDSTAVACNGRGSELIETPCQNTCVDGACPCEAIGECFPGETCEGAACACESNLHCGERNICCPEGDVCVTTEFCQGEECETDDRCLPPCDEGTRCGPLGELCCEGEVPVCHASGTCVPDCGDGVICGAELDTCCAADSVCAFDECRPIGAVCADFRDCDFGEYCEPIIGRCLPSDFPDGLVCREDFDFEDFAPEVSWHWDGVTVDDTLYANVLSAAMVADMNDNGVPDVVFQAYSGLDDAILVVIEGEGGTTIYTNDQITLYGAGHVALANVDGDVYPEIATTLGDGVGIIDDIVNCPAPDGDDDCYLWTSTAGTLDRNLDGGAPLFADFDGNGTVEVAFGSVVLDATDGSVLADGGTDSAADGSIGGQFIAAAADVNDDGTLELLTGDCAWQLNFETPGADETGLDEIWCNDTIGDGFPGVADIVETPAGEGQPEVIVVDGGTIYVLRGDTGGGAAGEPFESEDVLFAIELPGGGHGGPPNIADFDGDGRVEIGTAGIGCYTVFDIDCLGSTDADQPGCTRPEFPACTPGVDCVVEPCDDDALTDGSGDGVLWSIATKDTSSETTGSSVFDFQGDGRNEVLYNDECRFFALDGQTAEPFLVLPNSSRTNSEYPIVVDVNGDRRSEVLLVANNDQFERDCEDLVAERPDYFPACDEADPPEFCASGSQGVFAFGDPDDNWVRTRAIWNQHAYSITNVEDDASVPAAPVPSWQTFNTFRANRQGEVPLNSPDPGVTRLTFSAQNCPPELELVATVINNGTRGMAAGLPVSLYRTDGGDPELIGTQLTDVAVFPGGTTTVTFRYDVPLDELDGLYDFRAVANDDGEGGAPETDCEPDANEADLEDVFCRIAGPKD